MAADTPGLGDSPTPNEPHTIEGVAEIVSEGIDKLIHGNAQFDIVGFSFGGLVGGQVALLQSHRIRSLTIVGSPPFGLSHINPAHDITPFNQTWSFAEAVPVHRRNLELLMMADPGKVDALSIRIHHANLRRLETTDPQTCPWRLTLALLERNELCSARNLGRKRRHYLSWAR